MWVDYEPLPKNNFLIRVNDVDFFTLVKEEADYDPSKTESLDVKLNINDKMKDNNIYQNLITGSIPWIAEDVSEKVESALDVGQLTSFHIWNLDCKSWVANEFLDLMCSYDIPEQGLNKLTLSSFSNQCAPFEEEILTRLAMMCPNITYLGLYRMYNLPEAGRLSMITLLRQIIQKNPPIK